MKNQKMVNEANKCCGCGACSKKCPKKAITMKKNKDGFLYPFIDLDECVQCGICVKMCQYNEKEISNKDMRNAFVATSSDEYILSTSASGGAFSSIASSFIKNGGVVFGAALLNESKNGKNLFIVKHIKIDSITKLDLIKGSKYIQSNIEDTYEEIKEELKNGKEVLFSGTPCQVAAIKKYIGNNKNLYTIDIICHGVPNGEIFNDYIHYLEKKNNIIVKDFVFRDKTKGWGSYYCKLTYYDKQKKKIINKSIASYNSSYYQLFLDGYIFRENCYTCPYANSNRVGDITIGDFWGIEVEHSDLINNQIDINKGVSCLIVNNKAGKELLERAKEYLILYESKYNKVSKHNMQLNKPIKNKPERSLIINQYSEKGYEALENFFNKKYGKKRLLKNIWYLLPKKIRKIIKKS